MLVSKQCSHWLSLHGFQSTVEKMREGAYLQRMQASKTLELLDAAVFWKLEAMDVQAL